MPTLLQVIYWCRMLFWQASRMQSGPTMFLDTTIGLRSQRKAWGVSGEVILRRLLDAGRLPQSQYAAYRQWRSESADVPKAGGTRIYRYREPKHVFGDTFVRTVLDALNARHITLAKASSYLDSLKIKDLHQLEHLYAGF